MYPLDPKFLKQLKNYFPSQEQFMKDFKNGKFLQKGAKGAVGEVA